MILVCLKWDKYHIQGVSGPWRGCLYRFMWLFDHFVSFYDPKYLEICHTFVADHYDRNQNMTYMIEVFLFWGHDELHIVSTVFLDRNGDVYTGLCGYSIILSVFMVPNT